MLIVDAQVHIWGADTAERPWPPGRAHQAQKPYLVTKDLVLEGMEEAGVARAVLVPPSWEGDRNDLALEAARRHPDRFAVMGRLAIEKLESWGTDWTRLPCSWREALPWLSAEDKEWIMGRALSEWLGWVMPAAS